METYSSSEDEILPEANVFEFRADDILKSKFEALEDLPYSADEDKPQENKDGTTSCEVDDKEEEKSDSSTEESSTSEEDDDQALESSPVKPAAKKSRKRVTSIDEILKSKSTKRLPMESKRKIQELQLNSTRLKRRIALENERVLSACNSIPSKEVVQEDASSRKIILKFRYLASISKQSVQMGEKFATLFVKVAEIFSLKPCELLFCVKDQTIKENDTPLDLNLKYFDIIDCIPCKPSDEKIQSEEKFLIKVQSSYSRKKVDVYGRKTDKLEDFMKKYSEMQDIPLCKLKFEFDGEVIEGSETPDDLEMENGSCIDVKISKGKVLSDSPKADDDIEIVADVISQSNQLQVCVLD